MPEIVHWKCDFPNCGAISPLHQGMLLGWVKITVQAPLLEPLTLYLCPAHDDQLRFIGDITARQS